LSPARRVLQPAGAGVHRLIARLALLLAGVHRLIAHLALLFLLLAAFLAVAFVTLRSAAPFRAARPALRGRRRPALLRGGGARTSLHGCWRRATLRGARTSHFLTWLVRRLLSAAAGWALIAAPLRGWRRRASLAR